MGELHQRRRHHHIAEEMEKRAKHAKEADDATTTESVTSTTSVAVSTITQTVSDSSPPGVTTAVSDGSGGEVTIVIVFSTAAPDLNATVSANATAIPGNSTIPLNSTSIPSVPTTSSGPITLPPSTTTGLPDTATMTANTTDTGLSNGDVAGITVGSILGGLALLGLIFYFIRKSHQDRRASVADMMAPSSYPDPYAPQFSGGHNMPSGFGKYQDDDLDDDQPLNGPDGEMSQVSRRRSARSYAGTATY